MNGHFLAGIEAQLTVSSNDTNRHEWSITTEVVNHPFRWFATDTVIAKAHKYIQSFRQFSLSPLDFFQKLWDLTLWGSGVYNEWTPRGFLVMGTDLNIRSTMRRWRADEQETTLEDLDNQARSVLDLYAGRQKTAEKKGLRTEDLRRCTKGLKRKEKPHRVMEVEATARSPPQRRIALSRQGCWHKS